MTRPVEAEPLPVGSMALLERNSTVQKKLTAFPDLAARQREIERSDLAQALTGRARPLLQMYERWVDPTGADGALLIQGPDGTDKEAKLGPLSVPPYGTPPMGITGDYSPPAADLVKALLFSVHGRYYSVYGNTELAGHVPLPENATQVGARRYAGNPLFAVSRGLPPALQSAGVDDGGRLWLADHEGHLAVLDTADNTFRRHVWVIPGKPRLRLPRMNPASVVFASEGAGKPFVEFDLSLDAVPVAAPQQRSVPANTVQVLYCSAKALVAVTNAGIVVAAGTPAAPREQPVTLAPGEAIHEGAYVQATNAVTLLVGPDSRALVAEPRAERRWRELRVIRLSL